MTRESLMAVLDAAFREDIERHLGMGGSPPSEEECMELLEEGEINCLDSFHVVCAIYYLLRYSLDVCSLPGFNLFLELLIDFLDIGDDGAKLDFVRTALDDDTLPIAVIRDEQILERAKAAWPQSRFARALESFEIVTNTNSTWVTGVSVDQAQAICSWLRSARKWPTIINGDYQNIVEGALSYWERRAGK